MVLMRYYSQIGQDKLVNERIFGEAENGFFVDVGAHDGVSFSNTYFFEKHKNWKGLCIEPLPDVYKQLEKNRTSICVEGAIFTEEGFQDFMVLPESKDMLSGLVNEYDPRHLDRINKVLENSPVKSQIIKVKTYTLQSILDKNNVTQIDLLSIDTEGAELAVLHSVDFTKVRIECIVIENNYQDKSVAEFLTALDYSLVEKLQFDDIYLHKNSKYSFLQMKDK
ncbi:FkbM family methyltransferase [Cytobacillus firmus]|nr:FkbM family methyltransferase [Cytobacillus firmus]